MELLLLRFWREFVGIGIGMMVIVFVILSGGTLQKDKASSADTEIETLCRPKGDPITVKEMNKKLQGKGVFEGQGKIIIDSAKKHKIDPVLMTAIMFHETANGTSDAVRSKNNPGGLMKPEGGLMSFDTLKKGIEKEASVLSRLYIKKGLTTIKEIGDKYAPPGASNDPNNTNIHWVGAVTKYVKQLGGLSYKCEKVSVVEGKLKGISHHSEYPYASSSPNKVDKWRFYARQCTSFVAWRLNDAGVKFNNTMRGGRFSHARNWDNNAKKIGGIKINKTPAPGAVAQWEANHHASSYGHVAYVVEVKGDKIVVEDYNVKPFKYTRRTIPASQPSHYLHFK